LTTGVLLVLVSVLLGARVVAAADRSVQVWAVTHDIAAGTVLAAADLRPERVRLFDNAEAYVGVLQSPAGRAVTRPVHAGELLPRSAVVGTPAGALVSIPIQLGDAPGLARGDLIDVWSSVKGCAPVQVLSRVAVQEVHEGGGALTVGSGSTLVTVRVPPAAAKRMIAAFGGDSTIRLVVLDGDLPPAPDPTGPADRCVPAGTGAGHYSSPATAAATSRPTAPPNSAAAEPSAPSPTPSASTTGGSR
jgi:hypothetical protein